VNCFQEEQGDTKVETMRIRPEVERDAVERVRSYRLKRSAAVTEQGLRALSDAAQGNANLQESIVGAVKAGATLGEISDTLRKVFGEYREYSGF